MFGEVAFSGSRIVFWGTAPVLLAAAVALPLSVEDWTSTRAVLSVALSFVCLLAIPALRDARRFRFAARSVTGLVFLAYVASLLAEAAEEGADLRPTPRSDASLFNATKGLLVIGLPCLWYTVFGRFSPRRPSRRDEDDRAAEVGPQPGNVSSRGVNATRTAAPGSNWSA